MGTLGSWKESSSSAELGLVAFNKDREADRPTHHPDKHAPTQPLGPSLWDQSTVKQVLLEGEELFQAFVLNF